MALADFLETAPQQRWQECGVAFLLRVLTPEDAATLGVMLDSQMTSAAICRAVKDGTDHDINGATLARHRAGKCRC